MVGISNLEKTFALQQKYYSMYQDYLKRGINLTLDMNDQENNFDADWKEAHYFDVGADALKLIIGALTVGLRGAPKTILDFPSGSGRVTRHLTSFFPDARVVACDLYEAHTDFCAKELGVETLISKANFDDLEFDTKYDVIFSGSLLTHLPAKSFAAALRCMTRALSDNGVAIITVPGRYVEFSQRNKYGIIQHELFDVALETVPSTGFGYVDYSHDLLANAWNKQENYGISLCRPHYVMKALEPDFNIRILNYIERGWDVGQDVLVFAKPGVNAWMRNGDCEDEEVIRNWAGAEIGTHK